MSTTETRADAKCIERELSPGEVIDQHYHPDGGHFSIFIGEVIVRMAGGEHRIANGKIYVPPGVPHEVTAVTPARMFCVGSEKF